MHVRMIIHCSEIYFTNEYLKYPAILRNHLLFQTEWAMQQGLKGAMMWSLDTDDFNNICGGGAYPLLSQMHSIVTSYSAATDTSP